MQETRQKCKGCGLGLYEQPGNYFDYLVDDAKLERDRVERERMDKELEERQKKQLLEQERLD